MNKNIILCGVGGQGTVLASKLISSVAMEKGLPLSKILRYGVIAADGSLIREGTQLCTKENFERFRKEVRVFRAEE